MLFCMYVAHQEKLYDFLSRDDLFDLIATRHSMAVDNDLRCVPVAFLLPRICTVFSIPYSRKFSWDKIFTDFAFGLASAKIESVN